jgi:hypothetical protein
MILTCIAHIGNKCIFVSFKKQKYILFYLIVHLSGRRSMDQNMDKPWTDRGLSIFWVGFGRFLKKLDWSWVWTSPVHQWTRLGTDPKIVHWKGAPVGQALTLSLSVFSNLMFNYIFFLVHKGTQWNRIPMTVIWKN